MRYYFSTFLLAIVLILASAPHAYASAIGKPANNLGLIGYWPMNEGSGNRVADNSGFGNFATTSGTTWVNGKFGKALHFDGNGIDNYAITGSSSPVVGLTQITVSAWIKATSPYANLNFEAHIVDKSDCQGNPDSGTFELLQQPNGTPLFAVYDTVPSIHIGIAGATSTDDGNWHLLTAEYDGVDTINLYVDGVLSTSQPGNGAFTLVSTSTPITFGGYCNGYGAGTNNFYSGTIDDVRVYERALPASEVMGLYKNGASHVNASSNTLTNNSTLANGLVGLWTFDGGDTAWTSTTVGTTTDKSGNGDGGAFSNMDRTSAAAIGVLGQAVNFNKNNAVIKTTTTASEDNLDITGNSSIYLRSPSEGNIAPGHGSFFPVPNSGVGSETEGIIREPNSMECTQKESRHRKWRLICY